MYRAQLRNILRRSAAARRPLAAAGNATQNVLFGRVGGVLQSEPCHLFAQRPLMGAAAQRLMSTASKGTVCVCGGGNSSHVFIPYFAKEGYEVTVFADFGDEAERLKKGMEENGGILVHDRCDPNNIIEYKGSATVCSKNAVDAVPQADYIVIALPSFAIRNVLQGIKPHLKDGAIIYIMPGQGGADYVAKEVLGDEIKSGKCTVAGLIPMPLNARMDEFGKKVQLAALKPTYDLAALPSKDGKKAAEAFASLLGGKQVNAIGHYVGIALHASNPNIHPARLYAMWHNHKEGDTYPRNPKFYDEWDDLASHYAQLISDERKAVWAKICELRPDAGKPEEVPHIKPYIESIYQGQIKDPSTLSGCFNTNDGYKGFGCPMKQVGDHWEIDFKNRYFTEDMPEGFCMYKGIADIVGVPTPTIDMILEFFQKFMDKEYIKDGKLIGKDVPETKSPQAFGIHTLDELLAE
eukprot:TRINITY_DN82_c0_g1_i2.p1 TRINITY_DN82_c0_g1~~TRINITY_DN82_c0_g1_i2.p1  ORF type:complete len:465 (+),score=177.03 TRINITY_DN82_c0_g1_i2:70-1464(+)